MFRGRGQGLGINSRAAGNNKGINMSKNIINKREEGREDKLGEDRIEVADEIQRITVSKEAQKILGIIVDKVNKGFAGGRVNRTQMANWILLKFSTDLDEAIIKSIRSEHFDEVTMLENILRQAKEYGSLPTEFKLLLQKQLGGDELVKKKPQKALTTPGINDVIKEINTASE